MTVQPAAGVGGGRGRGVATMEIETADDAAVAGNADADLFEAVALEALNARPSCTINCSSNRRKEKGREKIRLLKLLLLLLLLMPRCLTMLLCEVR